MAIKLHYINSEELTFAEEHKDLLERIVRENEDSIRELLPKLSKFMAVVVHPTKLVIPETGDSGFAISKNWIQYSIDPKHGKFSVEDIISQSFKATLYHELHHAARMNVRDFTPELLDSAVSEGLATVFERQHTDSKPPWGEYDESVINEWLEDFAEASKSDDSKYDEWFFKHPDGRRWIGYRVGTYIVDEALKHNPKETSATLFDSSAEEILRLSQLT